MRQKKLFEQIFSDAHVVDIDLSSWDQFITLYVLADHTEREESGRKALFAVEFGRVYGLNIRFNHLDMKPLRPDEHFQWTADDFRITSMDGGLKVSLWGLRVITAQDQSIKARYDYLPFGQALGAGAVIVQLR